MKTFEEQIKASAQRLRSRDNYRLPVRPLSRRRPYWGWVVSPAAAVAVIPPDDNVCCGNNAEIPPVYGNG